MLSFHFLATVHSQILSHIVAYIVAYCSLGVKLVFNDCVYLNFNYSALSFYIYAEIRNLRDSTLFSGILLYILLGV